MEEIPEDGRISAVLVGDRQTEGKKGTPRRGFKELVDTSRKYHLPWDTEESPVTRIRLGDEKGLSILALWDSGCYKSSFIDAAIVTKLGLKTGRLDKPVSLRLFDGTATSAGPIQEYVETEVFLREDRRSKPIFLYVTTLCDAEVVIGTEWMKLQGVVIDMGRSAVCVREGRGRKGIRLDLETCDAKPPYPTVLEPSGKIQSIRGNEANIGEDCVVLGDEAHVDQLRAVAGIWPQLDEFKSLEDLEAQFWEEPEELDEEEEKELLVLVPVRFHHFLKLFRQRDAMETLPPHRDYDMDIKVEDGKKMKIAPLYHLDQEQLQVLRETIDREKKAGRIRASSSSFGSPTFFVPKSDRRWRMVVDYRELNAITIRDVYPLPLPNQIFLMVAGCKFFSKFDLAGAYQLLRMMPGYEKYTAFRTPLGMFESLVVRDGLCNAPSVFQHFLHEVFGELVGAGLIIYIDDILLYAATLEKLRQITLRMLELAEKATLYFKAAKCEFEVKELKFLGFIISGDGLKADPAKVQAVRDFPRPRDVHETRSFLGLIGYYRRFIPKFSELSLPLTNLTKAGRSFEWGKEQVQAFEALKDKLCDAPVLAQYDPRAKTILQTDASHFGWGFVISQISAEDGLEHPIVVESGRFKGAQLNYTTTEKEFLAIVEGFTRYRHMLLPVETTVITDHNNLKYWMTPRQLSPRQARWAEILSLFRFKIVYRPGVLATMPDALSRRSDYHEGKGASMVQDFNFVQALPAGEEMTKDMEPDGNIGLVLRAVRAVAERVDEVGLKEAQREDDLSRELVEELELTVGLELLPGRSTKFDEFRRRSRNPRWFNARMNPEGLLTIGERVYVPKDGKWRERIIWECHDSKTAGHPGIERTFELVTRNYTWQGLGKDVEAYVRGCLACQRTKGSTQKKKGHLLSLDVPEKPWRDISMDFVGPLPKSNGYNAILVVVDRLTKWGIFIPCDVGTTSARLGELLLQWVIPNHGMPGSIVSDRGTVFTSKLWKTVCERLGIERRLSTAYHPQTDGQTERLNQVMEQYLRTFVNYKQNDWSSMLGQASLAYNNLEHSAIGMSPFYANYGYHPRWTDTLGDIGEGEVPAGTSRAEDILEVHKYCRERIQEANEQYARSYDKGRSETPVFDVGEEVMVSTEHLATKRPSRKLAARWIGPYKVIKRVGTHAYELDLPADMSIHPTVNHERLKRFVTPSYSVQGEVRPDASYVNDNGEEEYEVAGIEDSRIRRKKLEYLVSWKGYGEEETSWEPVSNVIDTAGDLVEDFHRNNPGKPGRT